MNDLIVSAAAERAIRARHQWIFSGAVVRAPEHVQTGQCVTVRSISGTFLAHALYNSSSSIVGRVICFCEATSCEEILAKNIENALRCRQALLHKASMMRLVNAEADLLSGLVVDLYGDIAVIQISSQGMELYKSVIVQELRRHLPLTWIYEKSTSPSRKQEKMMPCEQTLFGEERDCVECVEDGLKYVVDIKNGQKTGFFLDQRDMRRLVRDMAYGKRVANCCSYTGGFSVSALAGGAQHCISLDSSQSALILAERNVALNQFSDRHAIVKSDLFDWIQQESLDFDMLILDPPAFAKKKQDVPRALRGYAELNRSVMQKMPKGSILVSSSCSYHVQESQFFDMVIAAAQLACRHIRLLSHHRHALDHSISVFHPETNYLKSVALYLE